MKNQIELSDKAKKNLLDSNINLDVSDLANEYSFIRNMSDAEIAVAACLFRTGDVAASAKLLNLGQDTITKYSRKRLVHKLLRILTMSEVKTTGLKVAFDTLKDIMDDQSESANARIRAAENVLKWSGEFDKASGDSDDDDLAGMSIDDLEAVISNLNKRKLELEDNRADKADTVR